MSKVISALSVHLLETLKKCNQLYGYIPKINVNHGKLLTVPSNRALNAYDNLEGHYVFKGLAFCFLYHCDLYSWR
jgi:hypothetical protein